MIKTLLNPNHVLSDCDNITDIDGQRMASVLGKHVYGYSKAADNTRVDRVLGVDANGDVRWTKNIPGGGGGGETYTAGSGIDISDENVISADTSVVQPKLTAGTNVTISEDNVISAVDTFYQAGTGLNLTAGNTFNVNTDVIQEKLSAGANVTISSNTISATDTTYGVFTTTEHGLVPKADGSGDDVKFLRGDGTWQPPMTGIVGDANHPNYISVGSDGRLHYSKTKRLFWEFTFVSPSAVLTATDIDNGFVELVLPLGADGLGLTIMHNGNMVCMKGYDIEEGNPLNGRQLSFYILAHDGTSPRWLMDTGFETYTESVVNNYSWKAFKAIGLCAGRNVSRVDAVLRVPLTTETAGETFQIPGRICVSVFGVAEIDV
jgi:hypothetical protein